MAPLTAAQTVSARSIHAPLYKRGGSDNRYVRLQASGQKVIAKSRGTNDLKLSEIKAMPMIREHQAFMYARR